MECHIKDLKITKLESIYGTIADGFIECDKNETLK